MAVEPDRLVSSDAAVSFSGMPTWRHEEFGEAAKHAVTQFNRVPQMRRVLSSLEQRAGQPITKQLIKNALYSKALTLEELSTGLVHETLPFDPSDVVWAQTLERMYPTDPSEEITAPSPIDQHYRRLLQAGEPPRQPTQ